MKIILFLNSAVFLGFGIFFILMPAELLQLVGMQINQDGIIEARAMYAGLEIAIGMFLSICAKSPSFHSMGFLFSTLSFAGLFAFRLIGLLTYRSSNVVLWVLAALECFGMALSFFCFKKKS